MVVAQKLNCISWLWCLSVGTPWSHFSQDLGPWGHQNVILIPTPHPAHHQARDNEGKAEEMGLHHLHCPEEGDAHGFGRCGVKSLGLQPHGYR